MPAKRTYPSVSRGCSFKIGGKISMALSSFNIQNNFPNKNKMHHELKSFLKFIYANCNTRFIAETRRHYQKKTINTLSNRLPIPYHIGLSTLSQKIIRTSYQFEYQ